MSTAAKPSPPPAARPSPPAPVAAQPSSVGAPVAQARYGYNFFLHIIDYMIKYFINLILLFFSQPSMFQQMAATAGGVAVGSAVVS